MALEDVFGGLIILVIVGIGGLLLLSQVVVIVRPTERGLVERFGKYNRYAKPGLK